MRKAALIAALSLFTWASSQKLPGTILLYVGGNGILGWDEFSSQPRVSTGVPLRGFFEFAANARGDVVGLDMNQAFEKKAAEFPGEHGWDGIWSYPGYYADLVFGLNQDLQKSGQTRLKRIKDDQGKELYRSALALSADGQKVAFNSTPEPNTSNISVLIRNKNGDLLKTLKAERDPAWLPDGRLLTVCNDPRSYGNTLCLHDLNASASQSNANQSNTSQPSATKYLPLPAKSALGKDTEFGLVLSLPAVSPKGDWVAVSIDLLPEELSWYFNSPMRVWLIPLKGGQPRPLLDLRTYGLGLDQLFPTWSPDGKTIALSLGGRLAFVDVASGRLTAFDHPASGLRVGTRPLWVR